MILIKKQKNCIENEYEKRMDFFFFRMRDGSFLANPGIKAPEKKKKTKEKKNGKNVFIWK